MTKQETKAVLALIEFAESCHARLVYLGEHIDEVPPQIAAVRAAINNAAIKAGLRQLARDMEAASNPKP